MDVASCNAHSERPAVETCTSCSKPLCTLCIHVRDERVLCEACLKTRGGRRRLRFVIAGSIVALTLGGGALGLMRGALDASPTAASEASEARDALALRIVAEANQGRIDTLFGALDVARFAKRAARGFITPAALPPAAREVIALGLQQELLRTFARADAHYELLGTFADHPEPNLLIRLTSPSEGYEYLVVVFDSVSPTRVVDFMRVSNGAPHSELLRELSVVTMGYDPEQDPGPYRSKAPDPATMQTKDRIAQLIADGRGSDALDELDKLPRRLSKTRHFLLSRIEAALAVSPERHREAIEAYLAVHPDDPSRALHDTMRWSIAGRPDDALAALGRFDAMVGGDPYLDVERGQVLFAAGRNEQARARLAAATTHLPHVPAVWVGGLEIAVELKDWAWIAESLDGLEKAQRSPLLPSHGDPLWTDFFRSPEGQVWLRVRDRAPLPEGVSKQSLREARAAFVDRLVDPPKRWTDPPPAPPTDTLERIQYPAPPGPLYAYLTPDPKDGRRRPALVWAHGGFGGIGAEFWSAADPSNDQSAGAFVKAGIVTLFPSWRGENANPGRFEAFYGEVDDLLAAVAYLETLPYVDPDRIYIAGHSTGGTLALLAAASEPKVRAVFSFGGMPDPARTIVDGRLLDRRCPYELGPEANRLRSPLYFVGAMRVPTFYFEGEQAGLADEAELMQARARAAGAPVAAFTVTGADHFDILAPVTKLVAEAIIADRDPRAAISITDAQVQAAYRAATRDLRRR